MIAIVAIVAILALMIFNRVLSEFFNIKLSSSIGLGNWGGSPVLQGNIQADVQNDVVDQSMNQNVVPEIKYKKQVFNIPDNRYSYDNAAAVCKAYGARLANYDELENAYNDGAEWCSYGWSEGQMAYYPTQKKTFADLQKIKGHENDCGRPGINGGYIANPNVRFGVNCYGYKPEITTKEEQMMATEPYYPMSDEDLMMQARVDYYKSILPSILVSPFNQKLWTKLT